MTNFLWLTLHVTDLDISIDFYKDLFNLLEVRRFTPKEGVEICFLKAGESFMLELISDNKIYSGDNISLGIKPEREGEVYRKAKEWGIIDGPIMDLSNNMESYFIKDPDGFRIQIVREKVLH